MVSDGRVGDGAEETAAQELWCRTVTDLRVTRNRLAVQADGREQLRCRVELEDESTPFAHRVPWISTCVQWLAGLRVVGDLLAHSRW